MALFLPFHVIFFYNFTHSFPSLIKSVLFLDYSPISFLVVIEKGVNMYYTHFIIIECQFQWVYKCLLGQISIVKPMVFLEP